jgi:hypothetical protein
MTPRRCRAAAPVIHPWMAGRISTEEEDEMSQPQGGSVKTLAIRLEGDLHAQLSLVAQLDGLSLTDAIRKSIEEYIERKKAEPDFAARAAAMLDEMDREAVARRLQVEALFGKPEASPEGASDESPKGRSRRGEATS